MSIWLILQIIGVIFAFLYLVLLIKQHIRCWIFGIIASIISIVVHMHVHLYFASILAFFYALFGVYGWVKWAKGWSKQENGEKKAPIVTWSMRRHALIILATILFGIIGGYLSDKYTDQNNPYIDATITLLSFVATYMETRKVLSGWIFWFFIDFTHIYINIVRELYVYMGLSVVYTCLCVVGYLKWRKEHKMYQWNAPNPA